jgi:ATPase subunit of ABC transporter with duplicated ATPase domains
MRWMKGAELDKILAAEAAVDVFSVKGVSTDMLLSRLREAKDNKQARAAAKKDFKITEIHVSTDAGFDNARQRGASQRAAKARAAAEAAEEAEQRARAGLPPQPNSALPQASFVGSSASSVASADTETMVRFGTQARAARSGAGAD